MYLINAIGDKGELFYLGKVARIEKSKKDITRAKTGDQVGISIKNDNKCVDVKFNKALIGATLTTQTKVSTK